MNEKLFTTDLMEILSVVESYYPSINKRIKNKITEAFWYSKECHEGQLRSSGEPYFSHPIAATKILLRIKPDIDTICACLLHDVIEDTPATADDIGEKFGQDIQFLCEGVEKVAKIRISATEKDEKKFENIQKLFVAMAKDIRVIFVKLADRIHNLETLEHVRLQKQERIARESLEIYASVADKFGLHEFKSLIEKYCFKALNPKEYENLSKQIAATKKIRQKFIDKAKKEILRKFQQANFSAELIEAREKEFYSIFKKMKRKGIHSLDDIHDFLGVRVIVSTNEDCYRALGMIHSAWRPIPKRFKDYIAIPKPNGYQSLHTTVLGLGQNTLPTEIQIRTRLMHIDAEYGPAAHWAYKKTGHSNFDDVYLQKTSWLPRKISEKKDFQSIDFFNEIFDSAFSERIHVFTPKGDIKFFAKDSTPIDFAYSIHSDIGESCVGAKVNGTIKPLSYKLRNGDVISIITKKGRKPNPLWLKFAKSTSAKEKIRTALRKEDYEFPIGEANKVPDGEITQKKTQRPAIKPLSKAARHIVIGDEINLSYKIAPCCKPQKSDTIIAFKNIQEGFTVHRDNCPELEKLDPERFYEAHYLLPKRLKILVNDDYGVLFKITSIMSGHHVKVYKVNTKSDHNNNTALMNFTLYVHSEKEYQDLLNDISKTRHFVEFTQK